MTHVTCRLTAKNWDQLRDPTFGNRVWAAYTFYPARSLDDLVVPREVHCWAIHRVTVTKFRSVSVPTGFRRHLVEDPGKTGRTLFLKRLQ